MDLMRKHLEDEWSRPDKFNKCWSDDEPGSDISGKLEKFVSVQQACKDMRDTADLVSGKTKGLTRFYSNSCGNHSRTGSCGCISSLKDFSSDEVQPDCEALNCYDNDGLVQSALNALRRKNEVCANAETNAQAKAKFSSATEWMLLASFGSKARQCASETCRDHKGAKRSLDADAFRSFLAL